MNRTNLSQVCLLKLSFQCEEKIVQQVAYSQIYYQRADISVHIQLRFLRVRFFCTPVPVLWLQRMAHALLTAASSRSCR